MRQEGHPIKKGCPIREAKGGRKAKGPLISKDMSIAVVSYKAI